SDGGDVTLSSISCVMVASFLKEYGDRSWGLQRLPTRRPVPRLGARGRSLALYSAGGGASKRTPTGGPQSPRREVFSSAGGDPYNDAWCRRLTSNGRS